MVDPGDQKVEVGSTAVDFGVDVAGVLDPR